MDIKARAAYAWGRIVNLFTGRKPDIEVELEEISDPVSETETVITPVEEAVEEINQKAAEPVQMQETEDVPEERKAAEEDPGPVSSVAPLPEREMPPEEAELPSRMTDEYVEWMKAQLEKDEGEEENSPVE